MDHFFTFLAVLGTILGGKKGSERRFLRAFFEYQKMGQTKKRSGHPPQDSVLGGWGPLIQANQLASYRLKATSYRLQATRLQATRLQATGYKSLRLQATGYKIRGWRYKGLALTVWNTPCVPKARWRIFNDPFIHR